MSNIVKVRTTVGTAVLVLAIWEALARIWNDEELRRTLVERGRERVKKFSWHATATATVEAYYDVLRYKSTPRWRREAQQS